MNKKAQGMAVLIWVFMALIVGVVLFQSASQTVGDTTNTVPASNITVTMAANGARVDLTGQELLSTPIVTNATGGEVIAAGNYTIDEVVSTTTGVKTISMQTDDTEYASTSVNVSYDYGQDGYIDSTAGRSMALLIPIFFALAIAVVAIIPSAREKFMSMMK